MIVEFGNTLDLNEMEEFTKLGRDLGLEGDQLLQFLEKRQAEAFEREERTKIENLSDLNLKQSKSV